MKLTLKIEAGKPRDSLQMKLRLTDPHTPEPHKTGYPAGINKFAPEYYDCFYVISACSGNLDAPDWILSGQLSRNTKWAPETANQKTHPRGR